MAQLYSFEHVQSRLSPSARVARRRFASGIFCLPKTDVPVRIILCLRGTVGGTFPIHIGMIMWLAGIMTHC